MAVTSVPIRSFNSGEFSPWMEGRTDINRYASSMRQLLNTVVLPQGPAVRRPGTQMITPAYRSDIPLKSLAFTFSDDQAYKLEFQDGRIRFIGDDGLLTYEPQPVELTSDNGFLAFNDISDGNLIAAAVGDELFISGYPPDSVWNGRTVKVTTVVGDFYTTDLPYGGGLVFGGTVARVYHIEQPYTPNDLTGLRGVQLLDVMYLLSEEKTLKLSRYDTYDWRLEEVVFIDGPYLPAPGEDVKTTLTPSATGSEIPVMTSATVPSGIASADSEIAGHEAWYAFDQNRDSYWRSDAHKKAILGYQFATPKAVTGYVINLTKALDTDDLYTPQQHAPGSWTFEGRNGADPWTVLDTQTSYVVYDNLRSRYFKIPNTVAYDQYQLNVTSVTQDQDIQIIIAEFQMVESSSITLTASSTVGINKDKGFTTHDIGRLIRVKGVDGLWRSLRIDGVTSSTVVTAKIIDAPLGDIEPIREWQLGYFSDTTGWPRVGCFFSDRLWLGNVRLYPDLLVASFVGGYENFAATDVDGTVNDDNSIVFPLNAPKVAPIAWIKPYDKGVLVGTHYGPWAIMPADNQTAISAKTPNARAGPPRGAHPVEPAQVDNAILFIDKTQAMLRACSYDFGSDSFKTPSMNLYAGHMSSSRFEEIAFIDEPNSIAMVRRRNGTVAGFTYNPEEEVLAWHQHDFSGGVVEEVLILPDSSGMFVSLWLTIMRVIAGVTWRFHEKLRRWPDFMTTLDNSWYVDCGLRYQGEPTNKIWGAWFLAGADVVGLADGSPIGTVRVAEDGSITLPWEASNIVVGLGYESRAETSRLEVPTSLGSAQGMMKRVERARLRLWQSGGGWVGRGATQETPEETYPLPNREPEMIMGQAIPLYSGDTDEIIFPGDFSEDATIVFRQPADTPLPFNVVAIIPRLNVHAT